MITHWAPGWARLARCITLLILVGVTTPTVWADEDFDRQLETIRGQIEAGEYTDAQRGAESLLVEAESTYGADAAEVAQALELLIRVHHFLGRAGDQAPVRLGERALEIRERQASSDPRSFANTLTLHAITLRQRDQFEEARTMLDRALGIASGADPPDSLAMSQSLQELGIVLTEQGLYEEALDAYEREFEISKGMLGPTDMEVARKRTLLARTLFRFGRPEEAIEHYQAALELVESQLGPDHPINGYVLNGMATVYDENGDHRTAMSLYERALTNARSSGSRIVPQILNNMGVLYRTLGDYERALESLEEALELSREANGEEHNLTGGILGNLGATQEAMGDLDAAEATYSDALNRVRESLGPEHTGTASHLERLAWLHVRTGDYTRAAEEFRDVLRVQRAILGDSHPKVADATHGLARALDGMGDHESARELYDESISTLASQVGEDHPLLIEPLLDSARLDFRSSNRERAFRQALRAERIARVQLRVTVRSLAERPALNYAMTRASGLDLLVELGVAGVEPESAWSELIESRALVLDELAERRRVLVGVDDPGLERDFRNLRQRSRELASLLMEGPSDREGEAYLDQLRSARDLHELAERRLAQESEPFRSELQRREFGFQQFRESLPPGTAVLSFFKYEHEDGSSYAAFVQPAGGANLHVLDIGRGSVVENLTLEWRSRLIASARSASSEGYAPSAMRLRRLVWDPAASLLGDAEQILVVPDGILNLLNWSTLVNDDGSFLIENTVPIHYLSAERDLARSVAEPATGGSLLALGGVDFDHTDSQGQPAVASEAPTLRGGESACGTLRQIRFDPLEASNLEIEELVRLWGTRGEVVRLEGAHATEAEFKRLASGHQIMHLATHGFALGFDCAEPHSGTRGIQELGVLDQAASQPSPHLRTLSLSGLALAGANLRDSRSMQDEDGILSSQEVAALDLNGLQWAVLSACDTGRGEIVDGEGVQGLRRAFELAGARTLIMSLWPVEDRSAREWMRAVYEARLERGLTTQRCVQEASLAVLDSRRKQGLEPNPAQWGAFVAVGDWR